MKIDFLRDYGYKVPDDTLSWLFKYVHDQIPEKQHLLFMKGNNDTTTIANVSVIIKYTREFASHISVHPKYGMYLLSAHVMKVRKQIKTNSLSFQIYFSIDVANGLQ